MQILFPMFVLTFYSGTILVDNTFKIFNFQKNLKIGLIFWLVLPVFESDYLSQVAD